MSRSFAQDATSLAGAACRWLGWRPDDFWSCTPAELAAIFRDDAKATDLLSRSDFNTLIERDRDG